MQAAHAEAEHHAVREAHARKVLADRWGTVGPEPISKRRSEKISLGAVLLHDLTGTSER